MTPGPVKRRKTMRKTALIALSVLIVFCLGVFAAPAPNANDRDFKVIRKAVHQGADSEKKHADLAKRGEVRWLKVLIADGRSRPVRLKVSLPIFVIKAVLDCTDGRHFKIDGGDREINLRAVFSALAKAGPEALVEIEGDGALIKVWLE
jgi:hypothetical protein